MVDPEDSTNEGLASASEEEQKPGTEEQTQAFLTNLRSSYSPQPTGLGFLGNQMSRNLRNSFQMPGQGGRFGLSAPFSFDEKTATTMDGEKIASDAADGAEDATQKRRTERLKTGDTLRQLPDQEILEMKNKDRLIIYKTLGWIMEDGKGNPITRQISPGADPADTSTFRLDRGGEIIAQAIEFSGVTTIVFQNGDKIVFDLSGVSSISRKKESIFIREPFRKFNSFGSPHRYRAF